MATSKSPSRRSGSSRIGLWLLVIIGLVVVTGLYLYREPIRGYAEVGTSYAARIGCSCRFVAGRSLQDCAKDKLAGMELITLVDDVEAKSVTARFPLVTANTATLRKGYGCVLETWED